MNGELEYLLISFYHSIGYYLEKTTSKPYRYKLNDTIVVSGTPRGGTTWLMEILLTLPRYKYVFEPFHKLWFPQVNKFGLNQRPYIPPHQDNYTMYTFLEDVFTGRMISKRPDFKPLEFSNAIRRVFANKLLVKFVRANRLLPWMHSRFPLRAIYLILRHPCATISSQLRSNITGYVLNHKNDYIPTTKEILSEASAIPSISEDRWLMTKLSSLKTSEERLAAVWSMDTVVPLQYLSKNKDAWKTIMYEKLMLDFDNEIEEIFEYIHEDTPERAYNLKRTPSKTASKDLSGDAFKQLSKWKLKLSERQINNILKVTSWFGLDFYNAQPEPDYDRLKMWGISVE